MTNATYANSVLYAPFSGGAQLLAGGSGGSASSHLFKITAGTTTDLFGTVGVEPTQSNPVFWGGAAKQYAIYPINFAATAPVVYDGSAAPAVLGGSPPQECPYAVIYKSRLVLGGAAGNIQRMYFSPVPDISSTWDTANSWIDADHEIVGFAPLNNALLILGLGQMSRIIGSTPPPNSDMDRAPVSNVRCIDGRSIVVRDGYAFFAGASGVYTTNGAALAVIKRSVRERPLPDLFIFALLGRFSAQMAHDLKNPLQSIMGLAEVLHMNCATVTRALALLELPGTVQGQIASVASLTLIVD
jgi:hypothetical protein